MQKKYHILLNMLLLFALQQVAWSQSNDQYSVDFLIISGGAGNMSGTLSTGENTLEGTVSIIVDQPIVSRQTLTDGNNKVNLGFWSRMLRTPGTPIVTASYDAFADKVRVDWHYDVNDPPGTRMHRIYRDFLDNPNPLAELPASEKQFVDIDLPAGQQYEYLVQGSNRIQSVNTYQPLPMAGLAIGKTSSNGAISGFIRTSLGSPIPNALVKVTNESGNGPAWGNAVNLNDVDDHITLSQSEIYEFINASLSDSMTMELWFNPSSQNPMSLISKGSNWELKMASDGLNYLSLFQNGIALLTSDHVVGSDDDQAIAVNDWNHVALVRKGAELKLYINGWLARVNGGFSSFPLAPQTATSESIVLGTGPDELQFYGKMDEFRVWNEARDDMFMEPYSDMDGSGEYESGEFFTDVNGDGQWGESDSTRIRRDYNRLYDYIADGAVINPTLQACFHMDMGSGNTLINGTDPTNNASFVGSWSSSQAPVYPSWFTDHEGAYQVKNLNFGEGRTFRVLPSKPFHEFSPPYRLVTLNQINSTDNELDFTVTNMISLSGYVTNDDAGICGEPNVEIRVDGVYRGLRTDSEGYYLLEVEPGKTVMLQPYKGGREAFHFAPEKATFFSVTTPQSQSFSDLKRRNLVGSVTGGACEYALGPDSVATVTLSSIDGCLTLTEAVDANGDYAFLDIPPSNYTLAVAMNTQLSGIPELLLMDPYFMANSQSIDMEASYHALDSVWTTDQDTIKFNYRSALDFRVDGLDINSVGHVGFEQNIPDTLDITVFENYYGGECLIDSGNVHIKDWVSDRSIDGDDESDTLSYDFTGIQDEEHPVHIRYGVLPGLPNIVYPHIKNLEITVSDPSGIRTKVSTIQARVMGQYPRNIDFATTAPELPLLILRRPPGDGSFATFAETSQSSTSFSMSFKDERTGETTIEAKLGVKTEMNMAPMGVGTSIEVEAGYGLDAGFKTTSSLNGSTSIQMVTTTTTEYTTATAVELMGDRGTVFVGGALNLLYGTTDVLSINDDGDGYRLVSEALFVPDGFATTYIYSRGYIEDYLLPELEVLSATDSTLVRDIVLWGGLLDYENSLRWSTELDQNYSLSGGGQALTITHSEETTTERLIESSIEVEASFAASVGFEVAGSGVTGKTTTSVTFAMGASAGSTNTDIVSTSFTLMDDDHGDDLTVDVGTDPVYGTPVFKVIAGNSSCPYEEWRNEGGEVVTTPRDEPGMNWMTPSTALNVHPDGVAEFKIGLSNMADSAGDRSYFLSYLTASNTHGAVIQINGEDADESAPIPFTLGYLEGDSALITLSRPEGSDVYAFEDILLKFAPECETNYAGVTQGYTISFDAHFARPCTEAEIYQPQENWVVNTVTGDTLMIVAEGYDLGQSYFDELLVQYSSIGEVTWFAVDTLIADTLRFYDDLYKQLFWDVGTLPDGVYDIRLQSRCLAGLLNNEMPPLRGIIDRQIPEVLGSPEPMDGVLNFNDEIAVNFTEPINPESISDVAITLLDLSTDEFITDFELTVSEGRLVIIPGLLNRYIENHTLRAHIQGHTDLYGNPGEAYEWEFLVDRNPVAWSTSELSHIAFQGEPQPIMLELNNTGSNAQAFQFSATPTQSITPLPEWLSVYPMEGSLNPGGSFEIQLDVAADLNNGEYYEMIYAVTPEGYEPLQLEIISMCPYPDWSFDFTEYEYSMNVTASLYTMSTPSIDIYDRVAAYVGDECRGWAQLEYIPELDDYQAFITVFSNEWSGEAVEFHLWDRTACSEYWQADTSVTFVEGESYGSPLEPIALNATGELGQNLALNSGFSWISLNLDAGDMSVNSVLEDIAATSGDRIIGQLGFSQFNDTSWVGGLLELDNHSMYQLDLENSDALIHVGFPVQPDITNIEVASGWNWISYLPAENINVNHALSSLMNSTDDLIKNQNQYAQYVEGIGWLGSLSRMYPGIGYKLESFEGGILNYPISESITLARGISTLDSPDLPEIPWSLDNSVQFQNNMTITALLESDTIGVNNPADAVVAFVGEEVRGMARPEYIPALDAYRVFLLVQGESGEEVSMKIWDSENDIIYQGTQSISFQADAVHGTPLEPMMLTRAPLGIGDKGYVPDVYSLAQNYPNPFNPTTNIGFGLPEDAGVSIKIYNLRGQLVVNLMEGPLTAGYRFIKWSGLDKYQHHVPSGVYLIVMNTDSFRDVKKMVLLK